MILDIGSTTVENYWIVMNWLYKSDVPFTVMDTVLYNGDEWPCILEIDESDVILLRLKFGL